MKKRYLFTILATVAVLLTCGKANNPLDDPLVDEQTRSETSGGGGGMGFKIPPREVVTDSL